MTITATCIRRRLRGAILNLIYQNHEAQWGRLDDITATAVLERLQFDVYLGLVRALLHDLKERGLVKFMDERNRVTGGSPIRQIQITPAGRDIIEKIGSCPAVEVD
jgi:hypothetical protein